MARQCSRGPNSCKSRVGADITPANPDMKPHHHSKHLRRRHEYCKQHPRQVNPRHVPSSARTGSRRSSSRRFSTRSRSEVIRQERTRREKLRGQIDRSARGGSGSEGGYGGGARRWPEQGGGHGGDAIATGVARG